MCRKAWLNCGNQWFWEKTFAKKASAGVVLQSVGGSFDTFPLIPVCEKRKIWHDGSYSTVCFIGANLVWSAGSSYSSWLQPFQKNPCQNIHSLQLFRLAVFFFLRHWTKVISFLVWRRCKNSQKVLISSCCVCQQPTGSKGPFAWTTICTLKHAPQLRSTSRHCAWRRATAHLEKWKMPGVVLVLVGSTQRLASLPGTRCSGLHRIECLFPACLLRWIMSTLQGLTT